MSNDLPSAMEQLSGLLDTRLEAIIEQTGVLVEIDSGSHDPDGVNAVTSVIGEALSPLGFISRHRHIGPDRGQLFTSSLRLGSGPKVLVLGHADTVWPRGTAAQWPFANDGTRLSGPGVGDMKCALSMAVEAIAAAIAVAPQHIGEITYALVPDEELGSVGSRAVIEELGRAADLCLTLEAGAEGGGTITSRGAIGAMVVRFIGRTSHSTDPSGISALSAAARLVTAVEALTDRDAGRICAVGILNAGTARQVVPDHAELHIDLRAPDTQAGWQLAQQIRELACMVSRGRPEVEVLGGITRPAMAAERSAPVFAMAVELAHTAGWTPFGVAETGGSDGSFVAGQGTLTLDGLGPVAFDECSRREAVEIASIVPRTALLAGLITQAGVITQMEQTRTPFRS
ncbi:MAG: glutamate carboxypeptidase [Mycobacterium sp.]|nr:glutamate carboxypeptidase [Mycobacterium sp.]